MKITKNKWGEKWDEIIKDDYNYIKTATKDVLVLIQLENGMLANWSRGENEKKKKKKKKKKEQEEVVEKRWLVQHEGAEGWREKLSSGERSDY